METLLSTMFLSSFHFSCCSTVIEYQNCNERYSNFFYLKSHHVCKFIFFYHEGLNKLVDAINKRHNTLKISKKKTMKFRLYKSKLIIIGLMNTSNLVSGYEIIKKKYMQIN